jgi:hypothetical protein
MGQLPGNLWGGNRRAVVAADNVSVTFCDAPGVRAIDELGAKLQVTPGGRLAQAKLTVPLNPKLLLGPAPLALKTKIAVVEFPGLTDTVPDFESKLKLAFCAVIAGHAAPIAATSTEPRPVARSYPEPAAQQDMM